MSDNNVVERNWRDQYPPVAILQNTRRALSASAHSAKREKVANHLLLVDLAHTYQIVGYRENQLRVLYNLPQIAHYPLWVVEYGRLIRDYEVLKSP